MEEIKATAEYHDTANLTCISNIAELKRQLQAIEMSYMAEKGELEPLDPIIHTRGGNSNSAAEANEVRSVVEDPQRPRLMQLKSVTLGVYSLVRSNVGLILLLICYSAIGAGVFWFIEGKQEEETQRKLDQLRCNLIADILGQIKSLPLRCMLPPFDAHTPSPVTGNVTLGPERSSTWDPEDVDEEKKLIDDLMKHFEYSVREYNIHAINKTQIRWSYWGAVYFCFTVFTTVGYGNIVPATRIGRVATMVYAALGIPLCLVVLSKVGKSLTRAMKFLWSFIRRFYYTGSFQRVRRRIPLSRFRRSFFQRMVHHIRQKTVRLRSRRSGSVVEDRQTLNEIYVPYEVDDKFNLPPIVAIIIAFLYTFFGAFLYTRWEDWNYLDAFYFTFISLCTIGFGDIVPDHPKFFLASFAYLLFGLALVAMVITVIMEAVTDTINKARDTVRHVGERIIQNAPRQCLKAQRRGSYNISLRRRSV